MMPMLAAFVAFTSCSHEETFDAKADAARRNPLQLTTTDDFTWENLQPVGLTVHVADAYAGAYTYGVQVFDHNPITHSDATLLAQGTATGVRPFYASIEMGKGTTTLYVRQTTPTGEQLVRSAEVSGTSATVDFGETRQARVARTTRAKSDYPLPAAPDDSQFPTAVPAGAQEAITVTAPGNYLLTERVGKVSATGVNLYVTGNVTLRSDAFIADGSGVNIYVLPGATLTMRTKYRWILKGTTHLYIAEGATFNKEGDYPELGLSEQAAVYNRGTMNLRTIEGNGNSLLYNLGSGVINGGQDKGAFLSFFDHACFINDGKASVYEFNEVRNLRSGSVYNYGEMNITGTTHINAREPVWVNEGRWTTENFNYADQASSYNVLNKCWLTVRNKMEVYSVFTVDAGGSVVTKDLEMPMGGINLGSGALFQVTGVATYKYDNGVFTGTGTENALLIMNCATQGAAAVSDSQKAHYNGKLVVACDNYQGTKDVTTGGGALLTSDVNHTGVDIPVTACNPGHVEKPQAPASVNYRYAVTFSGIYAMEDQWPVFGDYDMNDAVVKLSITAYGDGAATSEAEAKKIKLTTAEVKATFMAVGADNTLGAYVQMDHVAAGSATLTAADGVSLESGQDRLVLRLTESVSALMGGKYVNTKGNRSEANCRTVSALLSVPGGINVQDLDFSNVNFFITVNDPGNGPRREIHLKNFAMSSKGASSGDAQLDRYHTADNFVWGICMPGTGYQWPDEQVSIKSVNANFVNWVTSGGTAGIGWYNANKEEQLTEQ